MLSNADYRFRIIIMSITTNHYPRSIDRENLNILDHRHIPWAFYFKDSTSKQLSILLSGRVFLMCSFNFRLWVRSALCRVFEEDLYTPRSQHRLCHNLPVERKICDNSGDSNADDHHTRSQ